MTRPKLIMPVSYIIHQCGREVRVELNGGNDDFEDVTFLVSNCGSNANARKRVADYLKKLVEEFVS